MYNILVEVSYLIPMYTSIATLSITLSRRLPNFLSDSDEEGTQESPGYFVLSGNLRCLRTGHPAALSSGKPEGRLSTHLGLSLQQFLSMPFKLVLLQISLSSGSGGLDPPGAAKDCPAEAN